VDQRHSKGLFSAFIETLQMVLTKPGDAFVAMRREGGLGEPLLYGLIGGSFGYLFYLIFLLLMPSLAFMGGADKHNALAGMFGMGAVLFSGLSYSNCALDWHFHRRRDLACLFNDCWRREAALRNHVRVVCFFDGSTYPLMIIRFAAAILRHLEFGVALHRTRARS